VGKEVNVILAIDVQMVVNVGLIGYGNQAKRLEKSFSSDVVVKSIFHPTKVSKNYNTNNLEDLLSNDCIMITSPNQSHFKYIKSLMNNYTGYIFCEKPPVTSKDDLIFIKNLSNTQKQRIFFNFNFRFSPLNSILANYLDSKIIGNPIHLHFTSTHGLAFKKNYSSSWRSDGNTNQNNIVDTVSIHYIDFLIFFLGNPLSQSIHVNKISKFGSSNDSAYISLSFINNITASILVSYASPYVNEFSLLGTNGYLTIRENSLKLFHPRDTFSTDENFITPPIFKEEYFDMEANYRESLSNSLNYFINHVKNSSKIPLNYFNSSIASNEIILDSVFTKS
jgi:predicted dehydrogenase